MKITDIPRDLIADAAIDVQNIKSIDDIDSRFKVVYKQ